MPCSIPWRSLLVITLFPIGISPDPELLAIIAPGLLWVAALLAALLSLDGLFREDAEDGALEQLLLAPHLAGIGVGQGGGALADDRSAIGTDGPSAGRHAFAATRQLRGAGVVAGAGQRHAERDRRHRRGLDRWRLPGWGAAVVAGPAALCPRADLRCRRRSGSDCRQRRGSAPGLAWRLAGGSLVFAPGQSRRRCVSVSTVEVSSRQCGPSFTSSVPRKCSMPQRASVALVLDGGRRADRDRGRLGAGLRTGRLSAG